VKDFDNVEKQLLVVRELLEGQGPQTLDAQLRGHDIGRSDACWVIHAILSEGPLEVSTAFEVVHESTELAHRGRQCQGAAGCTGAPLRVVRGPHPHLAQPVGSA
jgi:hypothetical protein